MKVSGSAPEASAFLLPLTPAGLRIRAFADEVPTNG